MGGEFDFSKTQIPTIPTPLPRRGVVGDNIDRCITVSDTTLCDIFEQVVGSDVVKQFI